MNRRELVALEFAETLEMQDYTLLREAVRFLKLSPKTLLDWSDPLNMTDIEFLYASFLRLKGT